MNDTSQVRALPNGHRWLVLTTAAAVLIVYARGSYDFSRFEPLVAVPIWLFFLGTLWLVSANLRAAFRVPQPSSVVGRWSRFALVAAIPVGLLASGLDCTGATLSGCSPVCFFLIRIGTPLVALAAAAYVITGRPWLLTAVTAMCLVFLVPNCHCYNPLNRWWLHRLPLSPACFAASLWAGVIAIAALSWRKLVPLAVAACWLVNAILLGFFVGHHYFHFPW
jgi:hypothetical protein